MPALTAADPIGAEEFARWLEPFEPLSGVLALAVSGGADSMALAFCVQRWGKGDAVALIVDHGLRAESQTEAQTVKARLENIGLRAEILTWRHDPVASRVEEKARDARYRLLIEGAKTNGAQDLLLAHHRGDQAETVLMRLCKGSGVDGLAGMAAQSRRDGVRLLRPFLSLPKERLVATCRAAGLDTVADPTNETEANARGRLRKIMPQLEREGMTEATLAALAGRARDVKDAIDRYADALLVKAARHRDGGCVRIDRQCLTEAPRATAARALAVALRYVHNGVYPPGPDGVAALLDRLTGDSTQGVQTFYGCLVSMGEDSATVMREPSAAVERALLPSGGQILWDGRWVVSSDPGQEERTVRALGYPPHEELDRLAPGLRRFVPQGRVRASLPGLWAEDRLVAIPDFDPHAPYRLKFARDRISPFANGS